MSRSSAAKAPRPESETAPAVYVHLMSGEVAIISPATGVSVHSDMVIIYNGTQPVASYPRRDVFSSSKTETSPTLA